MPGVPKTPEERVAHILMVARGKRWIPVRPTSPCPRCGGPWLRDEASPHDVSGVRYMWHCFYCGEVNYGG